MFRYRAENETHRCENLEPLFSLKPCYRAENETRTRDPNLGKVVLYQLSYFRNVPVLQDVKRRRLELPRLAALPPQSSASTIPPPLQQLHSMVPRTGLEPARLSTHAPETCASTIPPPGHSYVERKTRLELATPTLARLCSTN